MQTQQMWLVAHLSPTLKVTRVEVVVGINNVAFVDAKPRRQLTVGLDVFEAFTDARDSSIRYYSNQIKQLRYVRDAVAEQEDPACQSSSDTSVPTESGFATLEMPTIGRGH